MHILITGASGFIGAYLMYELAKRGDDVIGIDNLSDYYDIRLKLARLARCGFTDTKPFNAGSMCTSEMFPNCRFQKVDIADKVSLYRLFHEGKFEKVVHLAAQAGSRYSIVNPDSYVRNNLLGFLNILEACRNYSVKHLIYASASSVYGNASNNDRTDSHKEDRIDKPVSLHASIKKSNELMAYSYCKLFGISMTGLRYFTIYGPYGRPDMSPMIFAKAITEDQPIKVFNNGQMKRDFTYIDDAIDTTIKAIGNEPTPNDEGIRYRIYDIASGAQTNLLDFIEELEKAFNKKAEKAFLPMQQGDFIQMSPDITQLEKELGYKSSTTIKKGIKSFVEWYKTYKNSIK